MKISCPICFNPFDNEERSPHFIPDCGHTLCRECLRNIAIPLHDCWRLKCPFCNLRYKIPRVWDNSIDNIFPQNFALKDHLNNIEAPLSILPKCILHDKPICNLCLTEECKESRKCCFECVRKNHLNCKNEKFLPIDQLGKTIKILNYTNKNSFYEDALQVIIEKYVASFNSLLLLMLQNYKANLSEFRVVEKYLDPENPEFDLYLLKLMTNSSETIAVGPYNFNEFDELDKHNAKLKEILESIKNNLATKCIDFITDCFNDLNKVRLDKRESPKIKEEAVNQGQNIPDSTESNNKKRIKEAIYIEID